jgi:hypothetical protein
VLATSNGYPLWGGKIDANAGDLFRLQDEVAKRVVDALGRQLADVYLRGRFTTFATAPDTAAGGAPVASETSGPLMSPVAQELYARGRVEVVGNTADAIRRAIATFERAIALDPDFAQAYAGLAMAYARMAFAFVPDSDYFDRADAMAEKAITIDSELPEARYVRGLLAWTPQRGFDHATALREFAVATAARPSLNEAHQMMAMVLLHVGMLDESIHHFERALAISPQNAFAHLHLGLARYLAGDFAGGREISRVAVEREASQWGLYQLGLTEIQAGNLEGAAIAAGMLAQQFPFSVLSHPLRGLVAALGGDGEEALRHVELTIAHRKGFGHYHHAQYDVACIYGQLGRVREGLDWFRDAAQDGFPCYPFFDRDPLLAPLRRDPRYAELTSPLRHLGEEMRALYRTLPKS